MAEYEGVRRSLNELTATPTGRRVIVHIVQEVRRHHRVTVRFGFSLEPDSDSERNLKAGVLSVRFVSTTDTILPPQDKRFRHSEQYGYFVYFGTEQDATYGEFERELTVPYHANRLVVTLLPFTNSSTKVTNFGITIDPTDQIMRVSTSG